MFINVWANINGYAIRTTWDGHIQIYEIMHEYIRNQLILPTYVIILVKTSNNSAVKENIL